MGRSVSYPSNSTVVTFRHLDLEEQDDAQWIFDDLIDDFRSHLKTLFPSVQDADDWIDREDHVLAENRLARFGMSEYCGLVAYWIVPKDPNPYSGDTNIALADRWIATIADKFVAAFGELSKVGNMSNGEGVYRRIDK